MSQKTRAQLKTGIDTNYPDNTSGAIKPLNDRTQHIDEVDSALNLIETANQTVTSLVNYLGGLNVNGLPVVVGLTTIFTADSFPEQDGSTITLSGINIYIQVSEITTAKNFLVTGSPVLTAINILGPKLTYSGTGSMFSGSDASFSLRDIRIDHPLAEGFNFVDTVGGLQLLLIDKVRTISGAKYGTVNNMQTLLVEGSSALDVDDGITVIGSDTIITSLDKFFMRSTSATFIGLDLGASVAQTIEFVDFIIDAPAGAVGISGLINSGNVPVGRLAMVTGCEFGGGMTAPLQNITNQDIRWSFTNNTPIPDSRNAADIFLTGGSETITTGSAGDWQEIGVPSAGGVSWGSDVSSRFTTGTDGVITYIGERPLAAILTGRATVQKVGGGSNVIEVRLAKNWDGTASDAGLEKSRAQTQNADPTSVPVGALIDLVTGDDIRFIFSNVNGASDIIANVSSLEVNG